MTSLPLSLFILFLTHTFVAASMLPPIREANDGNYKKRQEVRQFKSITLPPLVNAEEKHNWIRSYTLIDKSTITHKPLSLIVDGTTSCIPMHERVFMQNGVHESEYSYYVPFEYFNGVPLNSVLFVVVDSTEREFTTALLRSGLYNGTENEQDEFRMCGEWTKQLTLENGDVILHTPKEFILNPNTRTETRINELNVQRFIVDASGKKRLISWIATPILLESEFHSIIKSAKCVFFPQIRYFESHDIETNVDDFVLTLKNGFVLSRNNSFIQLQKVQDVNWEQYFTFAEPVTGNALKNVDRLLLEPIGTVKYLVLCQDAPLSEIKNALIAFPDLYEGTEEERDDYYYTANWECIFPLIVSGYYLERTPHLFSFLRSTDGKVYETLRKGVSVKMKKILGIDLAQLLYLDRKITFDQCVRSLRRAKAIK